jgi:hypothetical protein
MVNSRLKVCFIPVVKTEREARKRRSTKLSIDFLGFLCYGEAIISLPKTAKADAEERCKHHTWSHHFEL